MEILDLKLKCEILLNELSSGDIKLYHLKSVRNFIFHFALIKNSDEKEWAYVKIDTYMNLIHAGDKIDKELSMELFNLYISPVGKIFVKNADFRGFLSGVTFCFWTLLLNVFIFLIGVKEFSVYIVINSVILIVALRQIYLISNKKVYGYRY